MTSFLNLGRPVLKNSSKNYYAFKFRIPYKGNKGEVSGIKAEWEMTNKNHSFYVMLIMYAYFFVLLLALFRYFQKVKPFQMSDLGLLQKWIGVLLVAIIAFDDPLQILHYYYPFAFYNILASVL